MAVLERSELQASPLADLHAIADQLGLDGYRRLRKPELIDAILAKGEPTQNGGEQPGAVAGGPPEEDAERAPAARRRRRTTRSTASRGRRSTAAADADAPAEEATAKVERAEPAERRRERAGELAEGVVELLGNGSAFLRVSPPEPSDEDVYISAAQVRRCELVSGDRVSGPVRTPRRSERYPSLVRIDTINGASADTVGGARYEELPVAYPSERLALAAEDPTLEAIEWLTPIGRGSRALIVGAPRAGKTETLRRLMSAVSGRTDMEVTLVLAGARPARRQDRDAAPAHVRGVRPHRHGGDPGARWSATRGDHGVAGRGDPAGGGAQLCRLGRLPGPGGRASG
jgi:transcription termination factor Rho